MSATVRPSRAGDAAGVSSGARRPVVAVVGYRLEAGRVRRWEHGGFAIPERYVDALWRAGLTPAIVAPPAAEAHDILGEFAGLLLVGGGDVDPARYGKERDASVYGVDPYRDEIEIALARDGVERGLPVFAICRGMQVVNVAFGGTLIQDLTTAGITGHGRMAGGGGVLHDVDVAPDSRVAAAAGTKLSSSSHHHQAVERVAPSLRAVAWTADGVVEALESGRGWLLAVQWHPEDTAAEDPAQQALFDTFADRARERAATLSRDGRS